MAALGARTRIYGHASGASAVRIGQHAHSRLLSNYINRLLAIRDGGWCLSRDCGSRQRRDRGHFSVYGGRIDAKPCRGAKRRPRFATCGEDDKRRVQQKWSSAAFAAALYTGAHYADVPNRRMQPSSLAGPTIVPLAVVELGSIAGS